MDKPTYQDPALEALHLMSYPDVSDDDRIMFIRASFNEKILTPQQANFALDGLVVMSLSGLSRAYHTTFAFSSTKNTSHQ